MNINDLNYYVRFVFNCSDGLGFSTDSSDHLKKTVKSKNYEYPNESFNVGDEITIFWTEFGERSYAVDKVEIRDIRYDTEDKLIGMHDDDYKNITDKDRFSFLTIFVKLSALSEDEDIKE